MKRYRYYLLYGAFLHRTTDNRKDDAVFAGGKWLKDKFGWNVDDIIERQASGSSAHFIPEELAKIQFPEAFQ